MAKQTFVADAILTAAQMNALQGNDFNQTVSTKTASYVLVAADAGTKVVMNAGATNTTITVNTSLFAAGDTLQILNISTSGTCTITAGTATVATAGSLALGLNQGGVLYFTSAGVSVFEANGITAAASGLTLISTTTIGTTVSSVTVTGAFSSTYDNYKINVIGGTSSVQESLLLVLGATVTGYYSGIVGALYSSAAVDLGSRNNAASWVIGSTNTNGMGANLELMGPNLAKNTFTFGMRVVNGTANAGGIHGGFLNNTTQYTDFTLSTGSGTLTGGTIKVYGYANS